jgi:CO dehydrogenase maturation factor
VKVAVTGKGGVGKTTVAAYLARGWQARGYRVTAVDADPDANLAGTLGYCGPDIVPLARFKMLVEERVGGGEGWGGFLRMNPRVDDIPAQVGVDVDGIRLLVMGSIERGRQGCACAANVLLREVLAHLILGEAEHLVLDMEAGIEHLGRGTAEGVDCMLVVVEPGWASLQTAARVASLARDLGVTDIAAVANKVERDEDRAFVRGGLPPALPVLAELPLDRSVEREARSGRPGGTSAFALAIERLMDALGGGTQAAGGRR